MHFDTEEERRLRLWEEMCDTVGKFGIFVNI